jgi:hypothetical protein
MGRLPTIDAMDLREVPALLEFVNEYRIVPVWKQFVLHIGDVPNDLWALRFGDTPFHSIMWLPTRLQTLEIDNKVVYMPIILPITLQTLKLGDNILSFSYTGTLPVLPASLQTLELGDEYFLQEITEGILPQGLRAPVATKLQRT